MEDADNTGQQPTPPSIAAGCYASGPETPKEVYERMNGKIREFMYRVNDDGEVIRVEVVSHGNGGWTRVRFKDGTEKNMQRNGEGWATDALEACDFWLIKACRYYEDLRHTRDEGLRRLKDAINLLENFDPASLDA